MSDTGQTGGMDGPGSQTAPVTDPASASNIHVFGICFLIFTMSIFYMLVTTWPVLVTVPGGPRPLQKRCAAASTDGWIAEKKQLVDHRDTCIGSKRAQPPPFPSADAEGYEKPRLRSAVGDGGLGVTCC